MRNGDEKSMFWDCFSSAETESHVKMWLVKNNVNIFEKLKEYTVFNNVKHLCKQLISRIFFFSFLNKIIIKPNTFFEF